MKSRAHYVLDDLLYSSDQKILFMGLPSLRITDFAWAVEFGEASQDPDRGVALVRFEILLPRHSIPPFWGSPTHFRIVCKGSHVSAIYHSTWHRTAVFYALRKHDISTMQRRTGHRNQTVRCSPLILLPPSACEVCSR
jgi:hypothetical protein